MPTLRKQLIRLAHENPELRGVLLPLLKQGMEHPSKDDLEKYMKEHPKADPKNHWIKGEKPDSGGAQEEKAVPRGKGPKAPSTPGLTTKDIPVGGSATGTPLDTSHLGKPPPEYERLTGKGSAKIYEAATKDLKAVNEAASDAAQQVAMAQLQAEGMDEAAAAGKAKKIAKKAGKDAMWRAFDEKYLKEYGDPAVHAHQMATTMAKYETPGVKYATVGDAPLKKGSEALKTIRGNTENVIKRYQKALPAKFKSEALRRASDLIMDSVDQALKDGTLGDITESDLNNMMTSTMEQIIYQDVESAKRVLSDHGTRHIITNMESMDNIFDVLGKEGKSLTGAEKLGAYLVMAHHDLGYTTAAAKDAPAGDVLMKAHPRFSRALVEGNPFWKKAFGDKTETLLNSMSTHSESATDWEDHPIESTIRLADNTSCFSNEKLPDMLATDPEASAIMAKMMVLQKSGGPRRFGETEWEDPEDEKEFEDLREQLISQVDDLQVDDDIKEPLRESLRKDLSPHSPEFLLTMFGGKKSGFQTEKGPDGKIRMVVNIKATPERQVLDSLFGDVANFQMDRMLDDYDIQGKSADSLEFHNLPSVEGKDAEAKLVTRGPNSGIRFHFEDTDTADTGFLKDIKGVGDHTIRMDLLKYARQASRLPPEERKKLRKQLMADVGDKLSPEEKTALEGHLDADHATKLSKKESITDPAIWAREILRFPLTQKEREMLGLKKGKKASTQKVPVEQLEQVEVGKNWKTGGYTWIEPVFHKCPAVCNFPQVFGRMNPGPAVVAQTPGYEDLIYDFGAVACRSHTLTCPYWKGLSPDEKWTLCNFKKTQG